MKSKKSLIIAPALAALFVAAAGSVSGTVAWFSSVRVFNTEISEFSVVETDGSLSCVMAASQGTEMNGANVQVKKEKADPDQNAVVLTHGSVDVGTGRASVVDEEDNRVFVNKGENAVSPDSWLHQTVTIPETQSPNAEKTVDVYYAVSWTMTFSYTFAADTRDVGVYLDLKKSTLSEKADPDPYFIENPKSPHTEDTAKGFRIGFYGGTGVHDVVWGNTGNELKGDNFQGVYAASTEYKAGKYILHEKKVYRCKANVTSSDWATDEANFALSPVSVIAPAYAAGAKYAIGDTVKNDSKIYRCKVATDDAPAELNPANWDEVEANELSYVSNNGSALSVAAYEGLEYFASDDKYERIDNGDESESSLSKAERICTLTTDAPNVTVNCAAWFEGTDPNVITGAAMKCMAASMSFYARAMSA